MAKVNAVKTFPLAAFCAALLADCATKTADIITYDSASLSNVIRVTDNRFREDAVRVSPDGSKILYCEENVMNVDTYVSFDQFSVMLLRDANLPSRHSGRSGTMTAPGLSMWCTKADRASS
jgi:hypothetical protein